MGINIDPEAEIAVLSASIINLDAFSIAEERLKPCHFGSMAHARIWNAMLECRAKGQDPDHTLIWGQLKANGDLGVVGGVQYLAEITGVTVLAEDITAYVDLVFTQYQRRRLYEAGQRLMVASGDQSVDPESTSIEAAQFLQTDMIRQDYDLTKSILDAGLEWKARNEERRARWSEFPGWYYAALREKIGPWQGGELIIVGGAPSMGKSAFCLMNGTYQGMCGFTVVYHALEMRRGVMGERAISYIGGSSLDKTGSGLNMGLYVDDRPVSLGVLCQRIRANRLRHGAMVAYVDHLGHVAVENSTRMTKNERLGVIVETLRALAQAEGVDIVVACQYNRTSRREKVKPGMEDLRDSGHIEEAADKILLLSRPDQYDPDESKGYFRGNDPNPDHQDHPLGAHIRVEQIKDRTTGLMYHADLMFDRRRNVLIDYEDYQWVR